MRVGAADLSAGRGWPVRQKVDSGSATTAGPPTRQEGS